jgi:hypothetical protein
MRTRHRFLSRINFPEWKRNIVFLAQFHGGGSMRKMLDKVFTGTALLCLVSTAYLSYYLRPWRWLSRNRTNDAVPDDPFAQIPLPIARDMNHAQESEKAIL